MSIFIRRVTLVFLVLGSTVTSLTACFPLAIGGAVVALLLSALLNAAAIKVPLAVQLFLMTDTLNLSIQGSAIIGTILFITFCVTLVSLIPSYLAARLKPVTAMHHIG